MENILTVKLGGSSATSPDLGRWIAAVERSSRPTVVVPGGGPFANAIRRQQAVIGYDDEAAHEMAILAMSQFGCALASLGRRFVKADDVSDVERALGEGHVPVWMARGSVLRAPEIEKSWRITSDSLAAWLCGQLGARDLLLVKRIGVSGSTRLDALVGADMVDPCFPDLLPRDTRTTIAGPADLASAGLLLSEGRVPGRAVERRSAERLAAEPMVAAQ